MVYYICPSCGHKQKSKAKKRVECHKCSRSYKKSNAKKVKNKKPDEDKGTGFFKYKKDENKNEKNNEE